MRFLGFFIALLSLPIAMVPVAHANATHTAQVQIDFVEIDAQGKEQSLKSMTSDFLLDWTTKKCEIVLKKNEFVYCDLDTSTDITNSKGELVLKSLPLAHFPASMIDSFILTLGLQEHTLKNLIAKILSDTHGDRAKGFDLPFYTCSTCDKSGKDLYNAYQSYVTREVSIQHLYLSGKKLVLRLKLQQMKAIKGAFNMIGDSNNSGGN